jgi:hypothetical protein
MTPLDVVVPPVKVTAAALKVALRVELAAKPLPVTVTVVPATPLLGVSVI